MESTHSSRRSDEDTLGSRTSDMDASLRSGGGLFPNPQTSRATTLPSAMAEQLNIQLQLQGIRPPNGYIPSDLRPGLPSPTAFQPRFPGPSDSGPPRFSGPPDTGLTRFGGPPDSGLPRFGRPDSGPPRFSGPDSGPPRFSGPDSGPPRFSGPDSGPPRFSGPDSGPPRFSGPPDLAPPPRFSGPPDLAPPPQFGGAPGQLPRGPAPSGNAIEVLGGAGPRPMGLPHGDGMSGFPPMSMPPRGPPPMGRTPFRPEGPGMGMLGARPPGKDLFLFQFFSFLKEAKISNRITFPFRLTSWPSSIWCSYVWTRWSNYWTTSYGPSSRYGCTLSSNSECLRTPSWHKT
jgi:hypothetical protein